MFAIPLTTTLTDMLASHVLGRTAGGTARPTVPVAAAAPVMELRSPYEDPLPDLDQRVREIGEW